MTDTGLSEFDAGWNEENLDTLILSKTIKALIVERLTEEGYKQKELRESKKEIDKMSLDIAKKIVANKDQISSEEDMRRFVQREFGQDRLKRKG